MTSSVTCLRCGHEFTPTIEETQLGDRSDSVISVKCPKCGKTNPVTNFL